MKNRITILLSILFIKVAIAQTGWEEVKSFIQGGHI